MKNFLTGEKVALIFKGKYGDTVCFCTIHHVVLAPHFVSFVLLARTNYTQHQPSQSCLREQLSMGPV